METDRRVLLNKKIRDYKGDNPFIISLQKQLKSNKYLQKITVGNRQLKVLSDKQYIIAESIL